MTTNYFSLSNLPLLDQIFVDEALSASYIFPGPQTVKNSESTRIASAASSFIETDFYKDLQRDLGATEAFYLRFPPNIYYDWHTDIHRNCCINFAIDDYPNSLTLFRQPSYGIEYSVQRVHYVPKQATILNNNVEHCVVNLSDSNRYILSIGFSTSTSFDDVKNYLTNLTFSSYIGADGGN
jgi:hypothetical protein